MPTKKELLFLAAINTKGRTRPFYEQPLLFRILVYFLALIALLDFEDKFNDYKFLKTKRIMVRKISLLVVLTLLSWNVFGQNERGVSLRVDDVLSEADYATGKIIISWTLSNNAVISKEISVGEIEKGDIFKIAFPGTDAEAAMVINTKATLSFNEGAISAEEVFSGFADFLKCKLMDDDKWIIWK